MGTIEKADITDMATMVDALRGAVIVDGGHDGPDGVHLELEDGRYIIVTGVFVMGLCRVSNQTVN